MSEKDILNENNEIIIPEKRNYEDELLSLIKSNLSENKLKDSLFDKVYIIIDYFLCSFQ